MIKLSLLLISIIFLASCQNITGKVVDIPKETNKGYNAHFCITEDCENIINYYIETAQNSIHCAFYNLNIKSITQNMEQKSKTIDVKLVIDDSNKIKIKGAKVAKLYGLMHNKFCVIDNEVILTGSLNPTDNGLLNDNNVFVIYSKLLAENYESEFNELWSGNYGKGEITKNPVIDYSGTIIENYFCPEDNCEEKVITHLNSATESIYFMTFSFTSEKVADSLLFHKNIDIKGVIETRSTGGKYAQYPRLKDFGINVLKDKNKKTMHHKVFIIDSKTVITGSYNPTESATKRNDENILIIHDPRIAVKFLEEFKRVWAVASE